MEIETGKTYGIKHKWRGRLVAKIIGINEEWIKCQIIEGKASGVDPENDKYIEYFVMVKKSMCEFSQVKSNG
jgi:hypothetical protein